MTFSALALNANAVPFGVASFSGSVSTTGLTETVAGFDFTVSSNTTVSALGWFDLDANGLTEDHLVAIFETSDLVTPVASATVNNASALRGNSTGGTNSTGKFRYTDLLSSITLTAGTGYTIAGAFDFGDLPYYGASSLTMASGVSFVQGRWGDLLDQTDPFGNSCGTVAACRYFGPNFEIATATTVPEPTTLVLAAMGLLGLGFRRRFA